MGLGKIFKNVDIGKTLASIGTTVAGWFQSRKNLKDQQKANLELADRQYGHQLDAQAKLNEYNAPKTQMERYKEAGLNTNLIYGTSGNAGNQSTIPQYQEQSSDFSQRKAFNPSDMLTTYNSLALARENVIMANANNQVTSSPAGIQNRQHQLYDKTVTGKYQRDAAYANLTTQEAHAEYAKQNAEAQFLINNRGATAAQLNNTWKMLQEQAYRNTTMKGLSLDQSRLVDGWTDILQGNFLTPQAKSIYLDLGKYGADMLKNIVPAKILQGINKSDLPKMKTTSTYDSKGKRTSTTRTREFKTRGTN